MAGISIFYSIIMLKWLSFKEEYIIMKILKFYKQIGKGYFNMDTMSLTAKYEDEMIAIRRHIHRHPELSNKEYKTTEFIREKLTEYGVEIAEIGMKTGKNRCDPRGYRRTSDEGTHRTSVRLRE